MSGINRQVALRRAVRATGSRSDSVRSGSVMVCTPPTFPCKILKIRHLGSDPNCKILKAKGLFCKIFKTNDLCGVFVPRGHNPEARGFCLFYVYFTMPVKLWTGWTRVLVRTVN